MLIYLTRNVLVINTFLLEKIIIKRATNFDVIKVSIGTFNHRFNYLAKGATS